jgi:hypothetical protein
MKMKPKDRKFIYAQSSDIKARTYLEYRKDMKKKAIAELEIKQWLEDKLKKRFKTQDIEVEKFGGDKFLWFLRRGGITREPDFVVKIGDKILYIEFQYAEKEDLKYYDFKISKVTRKIKGKRQPFQDRIFVYITKKSQKYAFIEPEWIVKNATVGVVPAWGSREAYRVARDIFEKVLKKDPSLKSIIETIDAKNCILEFQHNLISIWQETFSKELQQVIDEEKIVKILPGAKVDKLYNK